MIDIDTGDTVFHRPTRRALLVAYVHGTHLSAWGWTDSSERVADCLLVEKATPAERLYLLRELANLVGRIGDYALRELKWIKCRDELDKPELPGGMSASDRVRAMLDADDERSIPLPDGVLGVGPDTLRAVIDELDDLRRAQRAAASRDLGALWRKAEALGRVSVSTWEPGRYHVSIAGAARRPGVDKLMSVSVDDVRDTLPEALKAAIAGARKWGLRRA